MSTRKQSTLEELFETYQALKSVSEHLFNTNPNKKWVNNVPSVRLREVYKHYKGNLDLKNFERRLNLLIAIDLVKYSKFEGKKFRFYFLSEDGFNLTSDKVKMFISSKASSKKKKKNSTPEFI